MDCDARFQRALEIIERAESDPRPLVRKAMDMALRATGKRNGNLHRAAVGVVERLSRSGDRDRACVGRQALRELTSRKVAGRFGG